MSARISPPELRNLPHRSLRLDTIIDFISSEPTSDDELFVQVPEELAAHNNLPPLDSSPLFTTQDLPLFATQSIDFEQLSTDLENLSLNPSDFASTHSTPSITSSSPLIQQTNILSTSLSFTMTTPMPVFGERAAPIFNPKRPNEIGRFFTQLESLFVRSTVALDAEKKKYASTYVDGDTAETWEALEEYTDATKTYIDFKDKLLELYHQVTLKWILTDVDRLVGERQRIGIRSLQELSEFHLKYNAVSTYLINNDLLSKGEQSQSYLRVFDPTLFAAIQMRLQIQHKDHHPSMPYKIDDIYKAAEWVLQGVTTPVVLSPVLPSGSNPSITAGPPTSHTQEVGFIKTEQLGSILTEFSKTIVEAIQRASQNRGKSPQTAEEIGAVLKHLNCNFCGSLEHFIKNCEVVTEYIRLGKCKRNFEGKVVLPSGTYIPRDIPGKRFMDRIDEWHRRNPNQMAANTLFNAVIFPNHSTSTPQALTFAKCDESTPTAEYQLSSQDRIAALEAEVYSLRGKEMQKKNAAFEGLKTRRMRAEEGSEPTIPIEPERRRAGPPKQQPVREETPVPAVTPAQPTRGTENLTDPIHPFRRAQDATYAPPHNRNIAAPSKNAQPISKKPEPAYKTLPQIHDPKIASTVYNRVLNTPLTVTTHELLSLSPEVRAQLRGVTTTRRIVQEKEADSGEKVVEAKMMENDEEEQWLSVAELGYLLPDEIPLDSGLERVPSVESFLNEPTRIQSLSHPIYIEDPIEQYYRTLKPGEDPDPGRLIVAKESCALRSIVPVVDNHLKVECILDNGCQIIAMSEEVCHELAVPYDPTIILNMQSANGTIDPSLGLARNVPFRIGGLTLYMQVHVLRNPAYDILFGRPFDVLTESVIRNYKNEDQTIEVHDPNTGQAVTIPTISRGPPKFITKQPYHEENAVFRR